MLNEQRRHLCIIQNNVLTLKYENVMKRKKDILIATVSIISGTLFAGCSEDVDIETESSVNYTLTISPDFLKFVTPQVSYIDEYGNLVTITGVEELDGKVIESSAEISSGNSAYASAWTQQIVTGTGYKSWTIRMKFKHLNFHSYMGVKYLRNDFTENTDGRVYDFSHNIIASISAVTTLKRTMSGWVTTTSPKAYADTHISLSPMEYHQGDDIDVFLSNLADNPDKVGYYVDGEGNVTIMDEFEM